MGEREVVRAWRPAVAGVTEVLHARFTDHAYPPHTHDTWTLLVVDTGAVRYDLDRHAYDTVVERVTLLPPDVPHDGRSVTEAGFRKRVVYLDADRLDVRRIPSARPSTIRGGPIRLCGPRSTCCTGPWPIHSRRSRPPACSSS